VTDAPSHIGPYRIERELGRGGMGIVYLGADPRLDRHVAIKALPEAFAADPQRLGRFEREAKSLAHVSHPNIAGIHGVEEHDGRRFLILEYVDGETLAERLDAARCPSMRRSASPRGSPPASRPPTTAASCTATSSPPTSSSPPTAA